MCRPYEFTCFVNVKGTVYRKKVEVVHKCPSNMGGRARGLISPELAYRSTLLHGKVLSVREPIIFLCFLKWAFAMHTARSKGMLADG